MNTASKMMLEHFTYEHLPVELQAISSEVCILARNMARELDSDNFVAGVEVITGLRKLLEAKDCFVRAKVVLRGAENG